MKEKYRAIIKDYGYDGEGVAHLNGKVVFIPYCLQGEEVEFVLTEDKASFSKGMIENIVSASTERVEPPCPHFTKCGGCAYQHCGYQKELQIKKSLLEKQLKKVDFNKDVEVVASDCEYGYRNKITLFVDDNGLALKKRGTHEHCSIEKCYIVKDRINHAIEEINIFLKAQRLTRVYDKIVIRQESDALLINFYINRDKEVNYQGLFLLIGGECGIFETYDKKTKHLLGMDCFKVDELGLKCKFKPTSFHQVNNSVAERLYKEVLKEVKGNTIINCYSGAGVLSGAIAREKKRVFGIELGKSEHQDAEAFKDENNIFYLTNLCGDCACILPNIGENANTIIVDPPRSGMDKKVVDAINQKDSDRLIYISCNSATFVRDVARLENFKLSSVKLFDMFPRTGEYELLAVLEKADK